MIDLDVGDYLEVNRGGWNGMLKSLGNGKAEHICHLVFAEKQESA